MGIGKDQGEEEGEGEVGGGGRKGNVLASHCWVSFIEVFDGFFGVGHVFLGFPGSFFLQKSLPFDKELTLLLLKLEQSWTLHIGCLGDVWVHLPSWDR